MLWNKTSGLCGIHNGNPFDDFGDREGEHSESLEAFVSSWSSGQCTGGLDDICEEGSELEERAKGSNLGLPPVA